MGLIWVRWSGHDEAAEEIAEKIARIQQCA